MQDQAGQRTSGKRVEQLVFRDELTNAFNRRYLFQYLPEEIANYKGLGKDIWLFMIDVDNFKALNDKYGHLAGDDILKGVVVILEKCVRTGDTVIRYAGDEFTIILPGGELSNALAVAGRITKSVSEYKFKTETGQLITNVNLSIGIANFPDDAPDALRLIDLADKALYVSKQKGKNRISLVSDVSVDALREKEILERFPCPTLIERQDQLEQLKNLFASTKQENKFKMAIISGESGVGKTRLLDEFAKFLASANASYFYSACLEQQVTQPYSNLIINLEKFFQNLKDKNKPLNKEEYLKGLTDKQVSLLIRFLPAFKEILQTDFSSSQELPREEVEKQVKESLVQLLINISGRNSLCILCDDFHLIDKNSLDIILSLREQSSPIMFCGSLEDKDSSYSGEISEYPLVNELASMKNIVSGQIKLPNLSENGTSQMIYAILLKMEPSKDLDSLILKISKGNPLFIEELLKFLIQKGFIYLQKGRWGKIEINESDIPHSLLEVIQERIKALDPATQEIIAKAAVIGQDFNLDLLHRMGTENEGYILDILESAKKAGIIKQKVGPYGEEMSFVSDEIRRVLYDLMEQDKLKNLHQQLGEIQEGLYSGDIDKIAGQLYYHFKKAEDHHRATEYAKRLKESDGVLFGRAIEFAKEVLEETEAKKIEPLSAKSLELISDIVRLLYLVNINFALYPKASPMLQGPIDQIYQKITEVFARDEIIIFSEVKDELVVNGKLLTSQSLKKSSKDSFLSLLKSYHIETLTFKKGLSKKELVAFIDSLNTVTETASLSEMLKSKEISNIIINEISFEIAQKAKGTQQREKLEEVMLVDYLLGKVSSGGKEDFLERLKNNPTEIADALSKMGEQFAKEESSATDKKRVKAEVVAKSVQKIANQIIKKDPKDWDKQKTSLAKSILNLEPNLRRDVLLSEGATGIGQSKDIIKELIPEFPDDVVLDLLTDEFTQAKASPTKERTLLQKFLINPNQRKRLLPLLKEKFARLGVPKEDIPWILGEKNWNELNLDERVDKFSKMTAKDFLGLEKEIDMASLIQDAFKQNREDLLKIVLEKWKEFLREKASEVKPKINEIFRGIVNLIPTSKDELFVNLIDFLFDEFRSEKDSDLYSQLVNHLTDPTISLIDNKNFFGAKKIINKLNKENSREKLPDKQKICIQDAIAKIIEPARLKDFITELIRRIDEAAYYDDVLEFIMLVENPAIINMLIDEAMIEDKVLSSLGYFAAFMRRRTIGSILAKLMKDKSRELIEKDLLKRLSDNRPYIVRNAIELLVFINDPSLVKSMERLLSHEDANIRSKVIFALGKVGGKESMRILIEALKDREKDIILKALKVLGKIGDSSTLETLKRYTSDSIIRSEVMETIKEIERRLKEKKEI